MPIGLFAGFVPVFALLFAVPAWVQMFRNPNAPMSSALVMMIASSNIARTPVGFLLLILWACIWAAICYFISTKLKKPIH
jgi:type II secretory pathway component PulF